MEKTDDIDMILTLHPHGWSTCWIFIRGEKYEITISHVFSDPYMDLIDALSKLIKGHESVSFFWYGEPGGVKIDFQRLIERKNIILIKISNFKESYGSEIKELDQAVVFEIEFKNFITIAYLQLKKTYVLLKNKNYSMNRRNDFPFEEYVKFEKIVKEYMNFKE